MMFHLTRHLCKYFRIHQSDLGNAMQPNKNILVGQIKNLKCATTFEVLRILHMILEKKYLDGIKITVEPTTFMQ